MSQSGIGQPVAATNTSLAAEPWTTRRLRTWLLEAMKKNSLAEPQLCAEILLCHAFSCDRMKLFTEPDRVPTADELAKLRAMAGRALKHEPVQYLTGETYFFSLKLKCDKRALIPRHCTETLVEHVLQHAARLAHAGKVGSGAPSAPAAISPADPAAADALPEPAVKLFKRGRGELPALRIADVCTGTGCIALALAKNLPLATVLATDISADALTLAAENAALVGVGTRVSFRQGDLLTPLGNQIFDVITANPPYIPDGEWDAVPANVKDFEPHNALRGGADGLAFVRPIVASVRGHLAPGGVVAIEVASATAKACAELLVAGGLMNVAVLKDMDGLERVVVGQRGGE